MSVQVKKQIYYSVPLRRFFLLSVLSFGLYDMYWLFKNWECVRDNEKIKINPLLRAIFAPIFSYSLFKRVNLSLKEIEYRALIPPVILFIVYFSSVVFTNISDGIFPLPSISFLPLLYVQKQINIVHQKSDIEKVDYPVTWPQKILIAMGLIGWFGILLSYVGIWT